MPLGPALRSITPGWITRRYELLLLDSLYGPGAMDASRPLPPYVWPRGEHRRGGTSQSSRFAAWKVLTWGQASPGRSLVNLERQAPSMIMASPAQQNDSVPWIPSQLSVGGLPSGWQPCRAAFIVHFRATRESWVKPPSGGLPPSSAEGPADGHLGCARCPRLRVDGNSMASVTTIATRRR
jgi:hypothetical protein